MVREMYGAKKDTTRGYATTDVNTEMTARPASKGSHVVLVTG